MSDDRRKQLIREALDGVAEEMAALSVAKSGHVMVHFQNGIPMKVEWKLTAEPVRRTAVGQLSPTHDTD